MPLTQTRRRFLTTMAMAGVASVLRAPPVPAADGALETTTVRVGKGSLCAAPTYVAEEQLRAEGFTDVRYPDMPPGTATTGQFLGRGDIDFSVGYASQF